MEERRYPVMEEEDGYGSMTAAEPALAYGTNSYADVLFMLHSMPITQEVKEKVGRRLVLEVTGENLSRTFRQLDHFLTLKSNWDGYGALPVSRKVISNVKQVLGISDDEDWKNWVVGPEPNATLCLVSKKNKASISIGDNEFSYYSFIGGKEEGRNHVTFSPKGVLSVMQKMDK
jgi:hypothetical protein